MKIKLKELVEAGATLAEIMHELWNVTSEDDQRFKLGLEFVQKMAQEMGLELPPQAPQRQLSDKARALLERLKERFPADCTRFSVREVNRAFSSFNGQKINADDLRAIMQEIIDIAGTGELDGNTFVYPL